MTSYQFVWALAAMGLIALALLFQGRRDPLSEIVLGIIAGGCNAPLVWHAMRGDFNRKDQS